MPVKTTVDITGLVEHFKRLEGIAIDLIDDGLTRLEGTARDLAVELISRQIYDTPERGYERTGQLRESIYAFKRRAGRDEWEIVIGAFGGAGGRLYALFNERGTYGSRVTLESILQRALNESGDLIVLEYGDPDSGLEPRPWTIPTAVAVSRKIPGVVLDAIRAAERQVTRRSVGLAADD